MHYWGHHCHASGERGTGTTGNKTPSDTRSVPVTIQQSAVQPILSTVSFRYALIQPTRQENSSDAESRLQGIHFQGGFRDKRHASLEGRSKAAIAQAVVLRLLAAAGWDVFDLSQVMPGYISGNRSTDFALMPPGQPKGAVSPRVFIDVRTPGDNIESPRMERQLLALCAREEVPLAALTNGLRWLLFLWSPEGGRMERRFCEIDLRGDSDAAAADINRYLTRDRVSNGQAARSVERMLRDSNQEAVDRMLRDSNQEAVDRRAVIQGWRQVVGGLDEGLLELVATAAEQRASHRPDNRLVRRVLAENRAALLAPGTEDATWSSPRGGLRSTPSSFTLDSETRDATSWSGLLVGVCLMMRDSHPGDFEGILEIQGRKLPYYSRSAGELNVPRPIGDTGIFASCQGTGALIAGRARCRLSGQLPCPVEQAQGRRGNFLRSRLRHGQHRDRLHGHRDRPGYQVRVPRQGQERSRPE